MVAWRGILPCILVYPEKHSCQFLHKTISLPTGTNPVSICENCKGYGDTFCNQHDPYADYSGAFECMASREGEVAWVRNYTVYQATKNASSEHRPEVRYNDDCPIWPLTSLMQFKTSSLSAIGSLIIPFCFRTLSCCALTTDACLLIRQQTATGALFPRMLLWPLQSAILKSAMSTRNSSYCWVKTLAQTDSTMTCSSCLSLTSLAVAPTSTWCLQIRHCHCKMLGMQIHTTSGLVGVCT